MNPTKMSYNRIVFFVLLLMAPVPFSIDEYAPSLSSMAHFFSQSIGALQLSITAFMLALGISKIFSGPILDHFGRRKPLLISLIIYVIGSVLCVVINYFGYRKPKVVI